MEYKITYDPWADACAFFWYNGKEIFEYTQEDFDQRAKDFSEKGVTMVETFSMSHFRFGYYPYWKQITEALRKLVIELARFREFAERGGRLIILGNFADYREDGSKRSRIEARSCKKVPSVIS